MKFSKGDVVRRVLPSGTMVGGLMVVINNIGDKCTAVRDVSTGKYYIYRSEHLEKEGKATKILVNKKDLGMPPVFFIPGYGKASHSFNADFTYTVSYNLPWDFRKSIDRKKAAVNQAKGTANKKPNEKAKPSPKK